jgi:hypothetical protein
MIYAGGVLALVWLLAITGFRIAHNARMTADKVRTFMASVDLAQRSGDARKRALHDLAARLNALSLEERRRTRLEGLWAPWLSAMTEEEKAEFLEATMPTGLKQMLSAFETMPENDRRLAVSDALRQLREARETLRREGALPAEPPSTNPPVVLSQERQDQIVKLGLRTYYRESSAQTKAELAPLLEEMQRLMESGRLLRRRPPGPRPE